MIAALARRSVRPLLLTGVTCGLAAVLTVGTKFVLARPDVQDNLVGHGSYPSGHAVMTVTGAGLTLMLIFGRPAGWHLVVPLLPGAVLGTGLVIVGMHWAGDALGGVLLAEALLATAAAVLTRTAGVDRVSRPRRWRASA